MFVSRPGCRWLLAFLALAPAGGASVGAPSPSTPASLREEALALVARDDTSSLERAIELLDEASRLDRRSYQSQADRALAELLDAAARREAGRLTSNEAVMASGRDLRERALEELRPLVREHAGELAVVRALAVYCGLEGDAAQTTRLVGPARAAGSSDPWLDFAEVAAGLKDPDREALVARLAAFAQSHPRLLRARMMLARLQLDLQRADDALATLDEILAANPDHDRARQLKARILSPPAAHVAAVPVPAGAPPPQAPGNLPRKRSGAVKGEARGHPAPSGGGSDGSGR